MSTRRSRIMDLIRKLSAEDQQWLAGQVTMLVKATPDNTDSALKNRILEVYKTLGFVEAVKIARNEMGISLFEAKGYVETKIAPLA